MKPKPAPISNRQSAIGNPPPPPPPPADGCASCRFVRAGTYALRCHRYPPAGNGPDHPIVPPTDWCGEFSPIGNRQSAIGNS